MSLVLDTGAIYATLDRDDRNHQPVVDVLRTTPRPHVIVEPGSMLMAELGDHGEIVLRPAGVYPVEIYSDERIAEFMAEDRLTPAEERKLRAKRARR